MLINLLPLDTPLSMIQQIPSTFFLGLENAVVFNDDLFPQWTEKAFGTTDLKTKFRKIYDKYKLINDPAERETIISAFINDNRVAELCNNIPAINYIELADLPESIRNEIDETFLYLYNSAIKHPGFNDYVNDNIYEAINRFISAHRMQVCPFCGLEGYANLNGQSRLPLDHWLNKDIFPVTAVNFDNLIPIGTKCNERPAKGDRNILIDSHGNRVQAFYPFAQNNGINAVFSYINEPALNPQTDADWIFKIMPNAVGEQLLFESWNSIFNILTRYRDYYKKYIYPLWENEYREFIVDAGIGHANTVDEFRQKLTIWRASFPIKSRTASLIYRAFIDNLINNASEAYLFSLCENFNR